ncbi:4Fe-4S binding protein [Benzoatithermus flavus]|uniref:4Fe-4S binding protein n=1 Tax=Benzoatithermus flavus TaxID=3108223 RepID=A0ABU8XVG5_9PROT
MAFGTRLRGVLAFLVLTAATLPGPCRAVETAPAAWSEVMPAADRIGPVEGSPPAAAAFAGDRLVGYVFSTRAVGTAKGYSGKVLDILVGLDLQARITGAKLIEQNEPIAATGRTVEDLAAFVRSYAGRSVEKPLAVVRRANGEGEVDAISGATVTSLVLNDTILSAARAVARSRHLLGAPAAPAALTGFEPLSWPQLVEKGLLAVRRITVADADRLLAAQGGHVEPPGRPDDLFLEVATGLASAPRIGGNLAGLSTFERITAEFGANDSLIFIGAAGRWSVKGTAWRRTGTFERLAIVQGEQTFRLTGADHRLIDEVKAAQAPELREAGLFALRAASGFRPDRPWRLQVMIGGVDAGGAPVSAVVEVPYELPGTAEPAAQAPTAPAGASAMPLWQEVWQRRALDIAVLVTALATLTGILFFQDQVAQRPWLWRRLRTGFLLFTLVWLGWYATAQLSVVNVLTFGEALRTEFRWDFFLLEPLIFILWSYVAVALVFWGRGAFCGWLCPFGALQELANLAARRLGVPQLAIPFRLHERLRTLKFIVFLALFAVALGSLAQALRLVEIEPFKTAIVLHFMREAPFVAWALLLVAASLVVERFFCRYLCPLGAALALPARMRQFEWLQRHWQCGRECRICQVQCPVQAIQPEGSIHPGECIYCLKCQCNYHNEWLCPPMIERRKRRERRAAAAAASRSQPTPAGHS